ncbi:MAG: GntR family transcriptional regulator [Hyphomicrobiaceae bacterium]
MSLIALTASPDLIDQVHDRLLAAIVDGTLAPGTRVTQESIATRLGVSRQPVSHALQLLRRRGLLIEHGKRGLIVAPLDAQRIRDLYQVRESLEGLAAELAARRAAAGKLTERERRAAQEALTKGANLGADAKIVDLVDADVAFHSVLHLMSGNTAITETISDQWPHFMRSMGSVLTDPKIRQRVWSEHALVLAAVLEGKPDKAATLMRHHVAGAGEDTARRLERLRATEHTQQSP